MSNAKRRNGRPFDSLHLPFCIQAAFFRRLQGRFVMTGGLR